MNAARHIAAVGIVGGTAIGAVIAARAVASTVRAMADAIDAATEALEPYVGKLADD